MTITGIKLAILAMVPLVKSPFWDSVLVLIYLAFWLFTRRNNLSTLARATEIVEFHHRRYDDVVKKTG